MSPCAACGISQSKVVLIPAKGADVIMCGHSIQAIQVTGGDVTAGGERTPLGTKK